MVEKEKKVHAVTDINISLKENETLGIVGESDVENLLSKNVGWITQTFRWYN